MELKLWGGRFTKQTDQLVHNFNASISFDQKFYKQDIDGSIAHVTMLAKQNILTDAERDTIVATLNDIKNEITEGKLDIPASFEDIHSYHLFYAITVDYVLHFHRLKFRFANPKSPSMS